MAISVPALGRRVRGAKNYLKLPSRRASVSPEGAPGVARKRKFLLLHDAYKTPGVGMRATRRRLMGSVTGRLAACPTSRVHDDSAG